MKRIISHCFFVNLMVFAHAKIDVDLLVNKLNNKDLAPNEALLLLDTITNQYVYSDIENAKIYAQKGFDISLSENKPEESAIFCHYFGMIYSTIANYDSAKIYFDDALNYAYKSKSLNLEGRILLSMGTLNWNQNKMEESLTYHMKALSIFEKTNDTRRRMYVLANMGCIYRALHNLDRALFYLEQAKNIAEEENYIFAKIMPYYELSMIYADKEEADISFEYLTKALTISREINNVPYKILCLQGMGTYFYKHNIDLDKAKKYTIESLEISNEYGDPSLTHNALNVLANIYRLQKRYKECEEMAIKAWEIDSANIQLANNITYNIVMANIGMGNYEKASDAFDKFAHTMRQYNDKSLHEMLVDMEVKYETQKKRNTHCNSGKRKAILHLAGNCRNNLTVNGIRHSVLSPSAEYSETQKCKTGKRIGGKTNDIG